MLEAGQRLAGTTLLERAFTMATHAPLGVRLTAKTAYLRWRVPQWLEQRDLPAVLASLDAHERNPHPLSPRDAAMADVLVRKLLRTGQLKTTCLYRSLIRFSVLRTEARMPVEFVMGVRTTDDDLTAHAWLELDGKPLWEVLDHEYETTYRYGSGRKS